MSDIKLSEELGVRAQKLSPLLYALVGAEFLTVEKGRFANTTEAYHFLVKGKPAYMGAGQSLTAYRWRAMLSTTESIRTGEPQERRDYANETPEA